MSGAPIVLPGYMPAPRGYHAAPSRYQPAQRLRAARNLTQTSAPTLTDIYEQRDYRPPEPIFLFDARGKVRTILMPMGETTVGELDDLIQEQRERKPMDFDVWRERQGLPPREKAGALMAEAIQRRIDQHKRNPVTDPFRQPIYEDRKEIISIPERSWQKPQ